MRVQQGLWNRQNQKLLHAILDAPRRHGAPPLRLPVVRRSSIKKQDFLPLHSQRCVTTRVVKQVKELRQGMLPAEPLAEQESDDVFQWPTTLREVRNNMIRFDKCVLLTRVGNFYEVSSLSFPQSSC